MQEIKRIICPVDVYDFMPEAAEYAKTLAHAFDGKIDVLYVFEPVPSRFVDDILFGMTECKKELKTKADVKMKEIISNYFGTYVDNYEVICGNAVDEIIEFAEKHSADMIVMSSHGRSALGRVIHGSVTNKVLADSRIPVMVVKPANGH